jgi:hypothetical protein
MSTLEEIGSQPEGDTRPELRVIVGGLATEQAIQIEPIDINLPMDDFIVALHGLIHEDRPNKTPHDYIEIKESLEKVRAALSTSQGELAIAIDELTRKFYENNSKMVRVNGYLRDR